MQVERIDSDGGDPGALAARIRALAPAAEAVAADVAETIAAIAAGGDDAVLDLGERFDGVRPASLRVEPAAIEAAASAADPALIEALQAAAANIRAVAEAQLLEAPTEPALLDGQRVTVREVAVGAAAIYAPGGRAAYPSSVLMGAIPAAVAGVGRIVVASPPGPDGAPAASILAACSVAGVGEVYAAGGAQAIAALALGTETIEPVDVIAGPGSPWVQEAKLQLGRRVGIDGYAGPSELMVIADASVPAELLALDLCAQAEHGDDSLLVLASPDPAALDRIGALALELAAERPTVANPALALVGVSNLEAALALADRIAPEHLQLACEGAADLAARVRTAGCVFVGAAGGTAFGDYAAGSNHILPTSGAGRFNGPLGPGTFRRRMSVVDVGSAAGALAPTVDAIARAEGFPVHGESALARRTDPGRPSS